MDDPRPRKEYGKLGVNTSGGISGGGDVDLDKAKRTNESRKILRREEKHRTSTATAGSVRCQSKFHLTHSPDSLASIGGREHTTGDLCLLGNASHGNR